MFDGAASLCISSVPCTKVKTYDTALALLEFEKLLKYSGTQSLTISLQWSFFLELAADLPPAASNVISFFLWFSVDELGVSIRDIFCCVFFFFSLSIYCLWFVLWKTKTYRVICIFTQKSRSVTWVNPCMVFGSVGAIFSVFCYSSFLIFSFITYFGNNNYTVTNIS